MVILTWLINIMAFTSSISVLVILPFLYKRNRNRGVIQLLLLVLLIALLYGAGLFYSMSQSVTEIPTPDYDPHIFTLLIYLFQSLLLPGVLKNLLHKNGRGLYYVSITLFLVLVLLPYSILDTSIVIFIVWNLFQLFMMIFVMVNILRSIKNVPEQIRSYVKILSYIFMLLLFPLTIAEDLLAVNRLIKAYNFIEAFTFMLLMISISIFTIIHLTYKKKSLNKKELAEKSKLTEREYEIFLLLLEHKQNKEIANLLNISRETVKSHVSNILKKLEVKRRSEIHYLLK